MSTVIKHRNSPASRDLFHGPGRPPLTIEMGKVAELANAPPMVKYGETTVMVAVTASPVPGTA